MPAGQCTAREPTRMTKGGWTAAVMGQVDAKKGPPQKKGGAQVAGKAVRIPAQGSGACLWLRLYKVRPGSGGRGASGRPAGAARGHMAGLCSRKESGLHPAGNR